MTYPMGEHLVEEVYGLMIQEPFEKKTSFEACKQQIQGSLRY